MNLHADDVHQDNVDSDLVNHRSTAPLIRPGFRTVILVSCKVFYALINLFHLCKNSPLADIQALA